MIITAVGVVSYVSYKKKKKAKEAQEGETPPVTPPPDEVEPPKKMNENKIIRRLMCQRNDDSDDKVKTSLTGIEDSRVREEVLNNESIASVSRSALEKFPQIETSPNVGDLVAVRTEQRAPITAPRQKNMQEYGKRLMRLCRGRQVGEVKELLTDVAKNEGEEELTELVARTPLVLGGGSGWRRGVGATSRPFGPLWLAAMGGASGLVKPLLEGLQGGRPFAPGQPVLYWAGGRGGRGALAAAGGSGRPRPAKTVAAKAGGTYSVRVGKGGAAGPGGQSWEMLVDGAHLTPALPENIDAEAMIAAAEGEGHPAFAELIWAAIGGRGASPPHYAPALAPEDLAPVPQGDILWRVGVVAAVRMGVAAAAAANAAAAAAGGGNGPGPPRRAPAVGDSAGGGAGGGARGSMDSGLLAPGPPQAREAPTGSEPSYSVVFRDEGPKQPNSPPPDMKKHTKDGIREEDMWLIQKEDDRVSFLQNKAKLALDKANSNHNLHDRAALVELYQEAGGPDWPLQGRWLAPNAPLAEWAGAAARRKGQGARKGRAPIFFEDPEEEPEELVLGLDLTGRGLSGPLPPALGKLESLTHVWLAGNALSGPASRSLLALPTFGKLRHVDLSRNGLSGFLADELFTSDVLEVLNLSHNQLSGTLSPALVAHPGRALKVLDLSHNGLEGQIVLMPGTKVTKDSSLEHLDLSHNILSGGIPEELSELANLTHLDLSHNGFGGGVPARLGRCHTLRTLNLSNNQLSGPLPPSVLMAKGLREVDLRRNWRLTGALRAPGPAGFPFELRVAEGTGIVVHHPNEEEDKPPPPPPPPPVEATAPAPREPEKKEKSPPPVKKKKGPTVKSSVRFLVEGDHEYSEELKEEPKFCDSATEGGGTTTGVQISDITVSEEDPAGSSSNEDGNNDDLGDLLSASMVGQRRGVIGVDERQSERSSVSQFDRSYHEDELVNLGSPRASRVSPRGSRVSRGSRKGRTVDGAGAGAGGPSVKKQEEGQSRVDFSPSTSEPARTAQQRIGSGRRVDVGRRRSRPSPPAQQSHFDRYSNTPEVVAPPGCNCIIS